MRRFIDTLPGKALGRFAVAALSISTLMLAGAAKASAQISQKPSWAVVDFVSKASGPSAPALGRVAAEAVANELGKIDKYDVIAEETVRRTVDLLKLVQPITSKVSLLRLGQELKASSIVTGEVLNYRILSSGNTRHADVIMKVTVTDVASGLPVNGDALASSSADRDKAVTDDELLGEAISQGAATIVADISRTSLQTATVLNTFGDSALINQGTRTGFKLGQQVVILRGREQVATGQVSEIEETSSTVHVTHYDKGIQPGDRIRAIFQVPDIQSDFPSNGGQPRVQVARSHGNNSSFIQLLLLVGLAAFLFSGGRGSSTDLINSVEVQAGIFAGQTPVNPGSPGVPGILISYRPDQFISGNRKFVQYQAYKQPSADVLPSAVNPSQGRTMVETTATPVQLQVIDSSTLTQPNGSACPTNAQPAFTLFTPTTQLVVGTSYQYSVELIYKIDALDLPQPPTTGGECYFVTSKVLSSGYATPLNPPTLSAPGNNLPIPAPANAVRFQFNSVLTGSLNFVADYGIEVCSDNSFAAGKTVLITSLTRSSTGTITAPPVDISTTSPALLPVIKSSNEVWWRVGARNSGDRPGPIGDAIGQRYIWSLPQRLIRGQGTGGGPVSGRGRH